jgi:hypothetical protein
MAVTAPTDNSTSLGLSRSQGKHARCAEAAQPVDPWRLRLERVRGTTGFDGLERISTQTLMDILGVEQRERSAGSYCHLAKIMSDLGWAAVRVRDEYSYRYGNKRHRLYGAKLLETSCKRWLASS